MIDVIKSQFVLSLLFIPIIESIADFDKLFYVNEFTGSVKSCVVQKKVVKEELYGEWITCAASKNKYRSHPYPLRKKKYSFKKDSTIVIVSKGEITKGVWGLTDKNELVITFNEIKKIYQIRYFKNEFMILKDSSTYLSLKKTN